MKTLGGNGWMAFDQAVKDAGLFVYETGFQDTRPARLHRAGWQSVRDPHLVSLERGAVHHRYLM